jgi:hypothetical protein
MVGELIGYLGLTEISLFNPFSFTKDYPKEGEQGTFKF